MRKERCTIPTAKLVQNTGQFPKLPRNPRQWTKEDIDKTAKSIREDFDFLEDRPILVIPSGDQYVAFAGNLRLTAAKHVKHPAVPCVVYEPESEEDWDTIKRRAMKDNGSFGAWDFDALANEWDDLPLTDWGVPAWGGEDALLKPEQASTAATSLGKNNEENTIRLLFTPEQYARVLEALLSFGGDNLESCLLLALGLDGN